MGGHYGMPETDMLAKISKLSMILQLASLDRTSVTIDIIIVVIKTNVSTIIVIKLHKTI
jgi:hypothetical protein